MPRDKVPPPSDDVLLVAAMASAEARAVLRVVAEVAAHVGYRCPDGGTVEARFEGLRAEGLAAALLHLGDVDPGPAARLSERVDRAAAELRRGAGGA